MLKITKLFEITNCFVSVGADERAAVNTKVQGSASDLVKTAMNAVAQRLADEEAAVDAQLILQLHDEFIYEVSRGNVEHFALLLREEMEACSRNLKVQLKANLKSGPDWGHLEELKV